MTQQLYAIFRVRDGSWLEGPFLNSDVATYRQQQLQPEVDCVVRRVVEAKTKWECFHCEKDFVNETDARDHITLCAKNPVQVDFKRVAAENAELRNKLGLLELELSQAHEDNNELNANLVRYGVLMDVEAATSLAWRQAATKAMDTLLARSHRRMAHDKLYATFVRALRRSYGSKEGTLTHEEIQKLAEDETLDIQKLVAVAEEFEVDLTVALEQEKKKDGMTFVYGKHGDVWVKEKAKKK